MSKVWMMLVALLALGMFAFSACGDDEDGDDNGGGGDPFKGIDCTTTDTASCNYMICASKSVYDAVVSQDCSSMQDYCDAVEDCAVDYVSCMTAVCPAGTAYDVNNVTAMGDCSTNFSTCATNAASAAK